MKIVTFLFINVCIFSPIGAKEKVAKIANPSGDFFTIPFSDSISLHKLLLEARKRHGKKNFKDNINYIMIYSKSMKNHNKEMDPKILKKQQIVVAKESWPKYEINESCTVNTFVSLEAIGRKGAWKK